LLLKRRREFKADVHNDRSAPKRRRQFRSTIAASLQIFPAMNRTALSCFTWTTEFDPRAIDFSRPFIPEEFCPFSYLPGASSLPPAVVLRQNQLHALCGLELIQLFEWSGRCALAPLARRFAGSELGDHLTEFIADEARHSAQFAALCRAAAPSLYARNSQVFVRVPAIARALASSLLARPGLLPLWPWMMLVQEEKALHISRAYLDAAHELEPHFVAVHRLHAADEAHHINWDEELIAALWAGVLPRWRRYNARALRWLLDEFFLAPKRAGARLLAQLAREFPNHAAHLRSLAPALSQLKHNPGWQRAAYSREMLPRTLEQMARWPEFSPWCEALAAAEPVAA
jgi:hypothetical protein